VFSVEPSARLFPQNLPTDSAIEPQKLTQYEQWPGAGHRHIPGSAPSEAGLRHRGDRRRSAARLPARLQRAWWSFRSLANCSTVLGNTDGGYEGHALTPRLVSLGCRGVVAALKSVYGGPIIVLSLAGVLLVARTKILSGMAH